LFVYSCLVKFSFILSVWAVLHSTTWKFIFKFYALIANVKLTFSLWQVIFNIVEDHPRDVNPHMESLSIVYGDESSSLV
jgi:uncharacterized membrane protein YagU involved in acid resistance